MLQVPMLWSADAIHRLLLECGRIALKHYENPDRQIKNDLSIVTQADEEIEAFVAGVIDHPEKGTYLLGEETIGTKSESYLKEALAKRAWVLDPIDGTAPYAFHIPLWGVSLGQMEKGRLTEGAIYFPVTQEIYVTEGNKIYFASHSTPDSPAPLRELLPSPASWNDTGLIAVTQGLAKRGKLHFPNPAQALSCAVLPMAYLLQGRFLAYVGSLKLWDIGGGVPLLLKGGFDIRLVSGEAFDGSVNEAFFILENGQAKRWKTKAPLVFSPSEESFRRLNAALTW